MYLRACVSRTARGATFRFWIVDYCMSACINYRGNSQFSVFMKKDE